MVIRNITLKKSEVKIIFEYFNKTLLEVGKNANYSFLCYKNVELMSDVYNNIVNSVYNEQMDHDFQKFIRSANELILNHADRDEQGEILRDNKGNIIINENLVEYTENLDKLKEEYKIAITNRDTMIKQSISMLQEKVEFSLYCTEIENFPSDTLPMIVGIFGI